MLTAEEINEIETEAARYPKRDAVCIDALKIVQRHRGWVSDESVRDIAGHLGMSPTDLDSVATFYNLIFRKPVGRHVIMICDSVSCWIMGYDRMRKHLQRAPGNRAWRDDAGQSLYLAADRMPRMLRSCSGHDGGQRSCTRSGSAENRYRTREVQMTSQHRKAADSEHAPGRVCSWTCGPTSRPAVTRRSARF